MFYKPNVASVCAAEDVYSSLYSGSLSNHWFHSAKLSGDWARLQCMDHPSVRGPSFPGPVPRKILKWAVVVSPEHKHPMTQSFGFLLVKTSLWACVLHYEHLKNPVQLPQWVPYTQGCVKIHLYMLGCPGGLILAMLGVEAELLLGAGGAAQPECCQSKEQLSSAASASGCSCLLWNISVSCASEIQGVRQPRKCALTGSTATKCWTEVEFCRSLSSSGPCPAELRWAHDSALWGCFIILL